MRHNIIHIVLFILTVASTMVVGGPAYSITIMFILLGHETGHYLMSRRYGMRATLPFFLPFPFSPFGTLGAVIRMQGTISSRRTLFDTGVAGPLTSLLLSLPAIVIGLKLSEVIPASQLREGTIRLGDPLLFSFIQRLVMADVPENYDVLLHPIGYAGWVGLFVTALNLLPVGQLDGGHIAYALFGRRSRAIFLMSIAVMAFITIFYNPGWLLLLILIILFGFRHPAPLDDQTPLDGKRKLLGGIAFLAFILSFTPAPFPQFVEEIKQTFRWL
ncbi:MAG: site-2 protease family protein [Syntrophaceae bacterium]|nr:site-2 protease family protein [Syntrophaceae bacterium]